jgi:hypothetical protein
MEKQVINMTMWPCTSERVPLFDTMNYPSRSISVEGSTYTVRMQKPGITGQIINTKMKSSASSTDFQIKLIRDDGTVIGFPEFEGEYAVFGLRPTVGSTWKFPVISPSYSSQDYWSFDSGSGIWSYSPFDPGDEYYGIIVSEYNTVTKYWLIKMWPWYAVETGEKYWINAECQYDIPVQYPYRYKNADKLNLDDAVSIGAYDVQIPFFKTDLVYNPVMTTEFIEGDGTIHDILSHLELNKMVRYRTGTTWSWMIENSNHKKTLTVWCSVPWILHEEIQKESISASGFDETTNCFNTSSGNCEETICETNGTTSLNEINIVGENISYSGLVGMSADMSADTEYPAVNGVDYEIELTLIEKLSEMYPYEDFCQDSLGVWHSHMVGEDFAAYIFSGTKITLTNKALISATPVMI